MITDIKLKESIPSNTIKIIELYNKIESDLLDTSPNFQRKLVWKKQHKYAFIDTILLNYPFPEIYIASSDIDVNSLKAKEIVVDGQQRLNSIVEYIKGVNDFSNQNAVKPFDDLSVSEKKEFLNYPVSVKDLKDLPEKLVKEIFRRINSTEYSLNSNEILNAQYGDGEFAIFCKLLADKNFEYKPNETSIAIEPSKRTFINSFFEKNNIFSNNDVKRMFDSQYIMLISATILEGQYFGRSSKINEYLAKYNDEFQIHETILKTLLKTLEIIDSLGFSDKSYWFNKANLFTLIVEINKFGYQNIDINSLEIKLGDLETKADLYFVGEEENLKLMTSDEMKYFEVARQGSHEQSAREHRGKVLREILEQCKIEKLSSENTSNKLLSILSFNYSVIIPTATGLSKSIMDATQKIRRFLVEEGIHDYEKQEFGPEYKVLLTAHFISGTDFSEIETTVSLYRAKGRGDYRIWFSGLQEFAEESNELILLNRGGLKVLNISKYDYLNYLNSI